MYRFTLRKMYFISRESTLLDDKKYKFTSFVTRTDLVRIIHFLAYIKTRYCRIILSCTWLTCFSTDLISKLVTGETQDYKPMGVLALEQVELAEVPGGGASEWGHILDQDHPAPEHVEVHRVSLERGGSQVVEHLGYERHLNSRASTLDAGSIWACNSTQRLVARLTCFHGCQMALRETNLHQTHYTLIRLVSDRLMKWKPYKNIGIGTFQNKICLKLFRGRYKVFKCDHFFNTTFYVLLFNIIFF